MLKYIVMTYEVSRGIPTDHIEWMRYAEDEQTQACLGFWALAQELTKAFRDPRVRRTLPSDPGAQYVRCIYTWKSMELPTDPNGTEGSYKLRLRETVYMPISSKVDWTSFLVVQEVCVTTHGGEDAEEETLVLSSKPLRVCVLDDDSGGTVVAYVEVTEPAAFEDLTQDPMETLHEPVMFSAWIEHARQVLASTTSA